MVSIEKKRNTKYGSFFMLCFFRFLLVAECLSVTLGEWRVRPPTTYSVTIQSFPTLVKLVKDGKYESLPFTSGGYNWYFIHILFAATKKDGVSGSISQYIRLDNSSLINDPRDVYAEIKFFIYNKATHKYFVRGETEARKFHLSNTEFGVHGFTTAGVMMPERGYLFDGEHVLFGVDVFVAQPYKKWELLSFDENVKDPNFAWKLIKFSMLSNEYYTSGPFTSGGRNWVLKMYPNGNGSGKGNSLSLYLLSESNEYAYLKAKLRIVNQSVQFVKQVEGWSNVGNNNGWGFEKFISLGDLNDPSKGYLVNDQLKIEVEIIAFSKTDRYGVGGRKSTMFL
ncbi:unnamed protein product [Cochlearia groenlandica]